VQEHCSWANAWKLLRTTPSLPTPTPDLEGNQHKRIELEVELLKCLHDHHLPVCRSMATHLSSTALDSHSFISLHCCVWIYHRRSSEHDWMEVDDGEHTGGWTWKMVCTASFTHQELPNGASSPLSACKEVDWAAWWSACYWSTLDMERCSDPEHFGLIYGDVNLSNYFWNSTNGLPHMFDWDQMQLAGSSTTSLPPSGRWSQSPRVGIPSIIHPCLRQTWISTRNGYWVDMRWKVKGRVDRAALQRMVDVHRQLYKRFCKRVITELPEDSPIAQFCRFMNSWLDKE